MRSNTIAATNAFLDLFPKKKDHQQNKFFKAEDNWEIVLHQLQFAENIFPERAISMCPVSHPGMSYFSKNCGHVLGHQQERLLNMDISQFFNFIHPEDLPYVRQCFAYIKSMEPYNPTEYRFSIFFRFCNDAGDYAHIRNENVSIKTEKNSYLYLMLLSNVTDEEKFYHVKMDVSRKQKGIFTKISSYNPRQDNVQITPRQRDIAELIARGYANQEIAEHLNVSIYTVKNHKQTLFKKVNVKNSIELANFMRNQPEPAAITS